MNKTAFHISEIYAMIWYHKQHSHRSIDTPVTEQLTIIICIIFSQCCQFLHDYKAALSSLKYRYVLWMKKGKDWG